VALRLGERARREGALVALLPEAVAAPRLVGGRQGARLGQVGVEDDPAGRDALLLGVAEQPLRALARLRGERPELAVALADVERAERVGDERGLQVADARADLRRAGQPVRFGWFYCVFFF
jgi:hypothetical protein